MFLILLLKGFIIGVAFIIPGVSGGTLAVYLGVYQSMIDAISNIFNDFKKSFKFLLPIFLGIGISIILLAKLFSILLNWNSFVVLFFFIGLISGGVKHIFNKINSSKISLSMTLSLVISFSVLMAFIILEKISSGNGIAYFTLNFSTYLLLLVLGMIASITMIVPGISGSAVLLVLGFYTAIVSNVIGNVFDFSEIAYNLQVIVPFAVGALIGVFLFSKLIKHLLSSYSKETYFAIVGFIIASVIGVFLEIKDPNTAAEFSNQIPIYQNIITFIGDNIWSVVAGIFALVIGFISARYLVRLEGKLENE